jgi:hypothetical protein
VFKQVAGEDGVITRGEFRKAFGATKISQNQFVKAYETLSLHEQSEMNQELLYHTRLSLNRFSSTQNVDLVSYKNEPGYKEDRNC